ncbi:hypothetical protein V6N13_113731 [Hibiscus sabdariffa]
MGRAHRYFEFLRILLLRQNDKSFESDVVDLDGSCVVERLANTKRQGPVCGENMFIAGIFAVKMAIEMFKSTGWENKVSLVIFLNYKILLNWIENPLQRPWRLSKEFATFDVLLNDKSLFSFGKIGRSDNKMTARLAYDGLSKLNWFKAWW